MDQGWVKRACAAGRGGEAGERARAGGERAKVLLCPRLSYRLSSPLHTQALASSSLMPDPAGRGRRVSEREGRRRVEEAIGAREQTSVYFFPLPPTEVRVLCARPPPGAPWPQAER